MFCILFKSPKTLLFLGDFLFKIICCLSDYFASCGKLKQNKMETTKKLLQKTTFVYGEVEQLNEVVKKRTEIIHNWMKSLDDGDKQRYAINWRMPHII